MSSKRRLRKKSCSNKRRYPTIEIAQQIIRRLKNTCKTTGWLNAYYCNFCGGVHVGHAPHQKQLKIRYEIR